MPVNFKNIKTTGNRAYDEAAIAEINDSLQYLPLKQRASVLASVIEESGGNPLAKSKDDTYQGLLQWGHNRYNISSNDRNEELARQLQYMNNTFDNTEDKKSWTHGGEGSGYSSWKDAYRQFNDQSLPLDSVFRGFSFGYVRPRDKEVSYRNRLNVASQIYDRLADYENHRVGPFTMEDAYGETPSLNRVLEDVKADGGQINRRKTWDDLSLKEKAAMMKVAVNNGITNLAEIRKAYNEYAEGGPKYKKSDQAYYDPNTDTIYAPDSIGEYYQHEMFHARPDTVMLNNLRAYYENLDDNKLRNFGADLDFVKRMDGDPGHFYSPEELGARVSAAKFMLKNVGITDIDDAFLNQARNEELKYGNNFRDLLHMYNNNNLINIFNNEYAEGGPEEVLNKVNSSDANFVQRLKDPNRKYIQDWESNNIATHKLSVGTDEYGNNYIYPEVQEINGKLVDFTRPPYAWWAGMESAEQRGDTVRIPSLEDAIRFTEEYKKYYPKFNEYKYGDSGPLIEKANRFAMGGPYKPGTYYGRPLEKGLEVVSPEFDVLMLGKTAANAAREAAGELINNGIQGTARQRAAITSRRFGRRMKESSQDFKDWSDILINDVKTGNYADVPLDLRALAENVWETSRYIKNTPERYIENTLPRFYRGIFRRTYNNHMKPVVPVLFSDPEE